MTRNDWKTLAMLVSLLASGGRAFAEPGTGVPVSPPTAAQPNPGQAAAPVDNPPFLITQGLPHLVGPIKARWDDPELDLSPAQKVALTRSREETMASVKRLADTIARLEQRVVTGSAAGQDPEALHPAVDQIAQLKADATMIHLRCLRETRAILSVSQLEVLSKTLAR